jgi:hypothetical protein
MTEPLDFFSSDVPAAEASRRREAAARAIYPIVVNNPPVDWSDAPAAAREYCFRVIDAALIAMAVAR